VVDGVGDRGRGAGQPDLPDPLGADRGERVGFADKDDVHVGHVGVDGNEVVSEGGVRDSAGSGVGDGLLEQRLADAADGAAMIWLRASFWLRIRPASTTDTMRRARAVCWKLIQALPSQDVCVALTPAGVVPAVDASPGDRDVVDCAAPQRGVAVVRDQVEEPLEERLAGGVDRGPQGGGETRSTRAGDQGMSESPRSTRT
jgi:hypothetical protein